MCRSYEDRSVPRHLLLRILQAARKSPSAGHAQGVRFAVITDATKRRKVAELFGEADFVRRGFTPWLSVAPVHLVVGVSRESYTQRYAEDDKHTGPEEWPVSYPVLDGGKALMALYLAAQEYDLACGYLGPHAGPNLVEVFDLPQDWLFLGLVTLGYRAEQKARASRSHQRGWRSFEQVVRWL